jgi:dihydrofolate synthase/folylpolyglutamate synthase
VITTIGLDHQEFLGETLASVAREKAGIIKPGRPAILGVVPREVEHIFGETAAERGAPMSRAGHDFRVTDGSAFRFRGMGVDIRDLRLALRGGYQRENAATAIAAAVRLRRHFTVEEDAIRYGLANVCWPGRLEVVGTAPVVVLDGAHNVDGITALVRELPAVIGGRPIHLLFGVMRDKRWQPMVGAIAPHVASATVTTVLPPRGEAPEVLVPAFAAHCPVRVAAQPLDALETLLAAASANDVVLVTGSLFLVGAVYPYFLRPRGAQDLFSAGVDTLQP